MFSDQIQKSILLILMVSGIPLAGAAISGFIVSLLQAVFQIQEQSIGYCVKFLTVGLILALFADSFSQALVAYLGEILSSMSRI